jgi:hypothetical protein
MCQAQQHAHFPLASVAGYGMGPMDRFIAESPVYQYAVAYRSFAPSEYAAYRCLDSVEE